MTDVKTVFTTDIKQVERENVKLQKSLQKVQEELRKVKDGYVAAGDVWTKQLQKTEAASGAWVRGLKQIEAQQLKQANSQGISNATLQLGRSRTLDLVAANAKYIPQLAAVAAGAGAAGAAVGFMANAFAGYRMELEAATAAHREFQNQLVKDIAVSRDAKQGGAIEKFVSSVPGVKKEHVASALAGVTREMPTGGLGRRTEIAGQISRLAPTGQDVGALGEVAGQIADIMPGISGTGAAQRAALLAREAGGDLRKIQKDKMQRAMQQLMAKGTPADEALAMGLAAAQGQISPETLTHIAVGGKMSKDQKLEQSRLQAAMPANLKMVQGLNTGEDVIGGIVGGMKGTEAGRGALSRYTFEQSRARRGSLNVRREELFEQYDEAVRASHAGDGFVGRTLAESSIAGAKVGRSLFMPDANEDQIKGMEMLIDMLRKNAESTRENTRALGNAAPRANIDRHVDN